MNNLLTHLNLTENCDALSDKYISSTEEAPLHILIQLTLFCFSESQIFRMLVTNTEQNLGERTKHMDRMFTFMTQGNFPESHLAEPYQFVLQCISFQKDQKADLLQSNLKPVFISYNGIHLQQEETEGSKSIH